MERVSPTGHLDPDNKWKNESTAYDGNLSTGANYPTHPVGWGSFLEFTHAALNCDAVHYYCRFHATYYDAIDVDVFYTDEAWHDVYQGSFPDLQWVEKSLDGTHSVTRIRIRFHGIKAVSLGNHIREVEFNEVEAPPPAGRSFGYVMG